MRISKGIFVMPAVVSNVFGGYLYRRRAVDALNVHEITTVNVIT